MKILYMPLSAVKPAPWRATYCLKPDMKLLTQSLIESGWVVPIVARESDGLIIDGHYRWMLAKENRKVAKVVGDQIPVSFVNFDDIECMLMHIRLNLGRGRILGDKMSRIIRLIMASGKYTEDQVQTNLRLNDDEFDLMLDGTLFKKRKVSDHEYSPAWIPVEVPEGSIVPQPTIETPPNSDR